MRRHFSLAVLALIPLAAHGNMQSALHPAGKDAGLTADIGNVLFIGGAAIFAGVMGLAAMALFGPDRFRHALARRKLIIAGGIAFPVLVLSALLVYTLLASVTLVRAGAPPDLRIEVVGEMWWWRVRYLDRNGNQVMETANEVRIPTGQSVELSLSTADVIHSFWVPNLAGKTDMIPGTVNRLRIAADAPGIFRGQCAEYCGAQHANMAFNVVALPPQEFDAWLGHQSRPATHSSDLSDPLDAQALRGLQVFFTSDCAKCHTVRGTAAAGKDGPDLTHVGSRLSLAAAVLPNSIGAFGGWIAASQHIKPGNKMPSFDRLSAEDLRALAAYMESLQ